MLHAGRLVVDLIEPTLNHGLFVVRAAAALAEAETILADWRPHRPIVPTIRLGEIEIDIIRREVPADDSVRHPRFIATVPGQGYRFIPTFSNSGRDGTPKPEEDPCR